MTAATGASVRPLAAYAGSRFADEVTFAVAIAERAGLLVMERYEQDLQISHKSAKDVVTEVDHAAEELIIAAIRERFPGDGILAEESGEHHAHGAVAAAHAADVQHATPADGPALARGRTWIIDPIDGTVNYANGIPYFCVSVGFAAEGLPAAGVVHDPSRAETFAATADGPATLNGRVITASDKTALTDFVVALALSGRAVATRVRAVRSAIRVSRNMGSSALALAYVANGRFDALVQSSGLSAWDVAAAGLIAERAGATVTTPDGSPWFDLGRKAKGFGVVAAPAAHHEVFRRLTG